MALTLTLADAALKEFYLPAVRDQINNTNWWLSQIEQNGQDVEGRRAVLSLHVLRSSGVGSRLEGGTLPTAGNQGYAEERVGLKYHYGRIQINGPVIRAMKSDRGSFVRAVEGETKRITQDLKRDVNRQLWGTSNGVIATCTVSTTGQTTVLLATATTAVQMRQLEVGMLVDIGTVAEAAAGSGGPTYANKIVSVDVAAKSFVLETNLSSATASTDFVFRAGNGGATTVQREMTGIQSIVDSTGSLFNVDPATYPVWSSAENSNSGTNRSVSENLFAALMHEVEIKSGVMPSAGEYCWASSDGVFRAFSNLLTAQKRFANTIELKGGFKGLEMTAGGGSVPLVWERDCPSNTAFYLHKPSFKLHTESDWEWMDLDGAVLSRVANTDAYEATLFRYAEQAIDRRNTSGKIADLTEA
jgi:hypothetical protein